MTRLALLSLAPALLALLSTAPLLSSVAPVPSLLHLHLLLLLLLHLLLHVHPVLLLLLLLGSSHLAVVRLGLQPLHARAHLV